MKLEAYPKRPVQVNYPIMILSDLPGTPIIISSLSMMLKNSGDLSTGIRGAVKPCGF